MKREYFLCVNSTCYPSVCGMFLCVFSRVRLQFVIVAAFDHTNPDLPVEERVALGLKRCGVSITCE